VDLEIPWDVYTFLGNEFQIPEDLDSIPELEGQVFAQSRTGFPTTVIYPDTDWDRYLDEIKNHQSTEYHNQSGWNLRSGHAPSVFSVDGIRSNMKTQKEIASLPKNEEAFWDAFEIVYEGLCDAGCWGFERLTEREAWCGSDCGYLQAINMHSSIGAFLSKVGDTKNRGMFNAAEFLIDICRWDYERTSSKTEPMLAWVSKSSLKDARMPLEKIAEGKLRVFQAQPLPVSITGRLLIGDFIARFMKANKQGGFVGIIGFVMSRGGWHELLRDLSDDFQIDEVDSGDVSKWDKNWLNFWHWILCLLLAMLCNNQTHADEIFRHYDRVIRSPTHLAILGLMYVLLKGQPSGDIATIVFNTIIQWMMYAYAYCRVAPKEFHNYRDMSKALRLKCGGDDSVSALSTAMRSWLGGEKWSNVVAATFLEAGWTIILVTTPLTGIEFMGYHTIVADLGEEGVFHIPVLPLRTILAINEWAKRGKNSDVPQPVKMLSRYYACAEKSFPLLWSDDPKAREFVKIAWRWLLRQRAKYWDSPIKEIRDTARGIPTPRDLAQLYFRTPPSLASIMQRLE